MNPIETLAFYGEQILSYFDEVRRSACPRCDTPNLQVELVGRDVVIRCSVPLQEYNSEEDEEILTNVCTYIQHIRATPISGEPFTLKFSEGRPTAKNVPKTRVRRKRPTA